MLIPDSSEKRVHLPVRIVNGQVRFLYGKGRKMPTLRDGATGHIVLAADDLLDEEWKLELTLERRVDILPEGSRVLLGMRRERIPKEHRVAFYAPEGPMPEEVANLVFVSVKLEKPLVLHLRGTKTAVLEGGDCLIPALELKAFSLNHAYTLLSQILEPARLSHTGNVFKKGLYRDDKGWHLLDDLRARHQWEMEGELEHCNKPKDEITAQRPEPTLPL